MLVLFETPAGYAIFKLLDESKLKKIDNIWEEFGTPSKAQESLQLVTFKHFKDVEEAVSNMVSVTDGKLTKTLKKVLKNQSKEAEELAVGDTKLGSIIKEKMEIPCVSNSATAELMRGIRANVDTLLAEQKAEITAMRLALAHSLGRYKVKFNPEKIDTMIVQAVSLLDDLDKELNNYVMRCREWYGWHFPELTKIVQDPQAYAKVVKAIGMKQNAAKTDLSDILTPELEAKVKEDAEMSMGTDISEIDLLHISQLCDQIIEIANYRTELHEYLKNRMHALAPNLTVLLGELVGARLISKAGSLVGLAKCPASTVQILGAEKALFRALKTKKDTPKYGIIYHAQLISQTSTKLKGKIARKLAAKVSLSTRIDALSDETTGNEVGISSRAFLEGVIKSEMERGPKRISGVKQAPSSSYSFKKEVYEYDTAADVNLKPKKRPPTDPEGGTAAKKVKEEDSAETTEDFIASGVALQHMFRFWELSSDIDESF
ncbi:snoRNA binding domain, fibrillarin domain-containing protein [Ditylenchus destructor]|nr:snoRNA binding domain, fibrillarin domain-containing protein [Ditylenchus destructor]